MVVAFACTLSQGDGKNKLHCLVCWTWKCTFWCMCTWEFQRQTYQAFGYTYTWPFVFIGSKLHSRPQACLLATSEVNTVFFFRQRQKPNTQVCCAIEWPSAFCKWPPAWGSCRRCHSAWKTCCGWAWAHQSVIHHPLIPEYKAYVHAEQPVSNPSHKLLAAPPQTGAEEQNKLSSQSQKRGIQAC